MGSERRTNLDRLPLLVLHALFAVLAVLSLVACRRSGDAWERVLETGVLRVGMDASFPPFEYVDAEGNLAGFDVDLAREVAARLGAGAREAEGIRVQFTANLPYDGLYDALTAEQVDVVISALYADSARVGPFAYSVPYFDAGQVLVVAGDTEDVRSLEDLEGLALAVEFGSEGDVVARAWSRRLTALRVLSLPSADEALGQVASGEADAALADRLSALARSGEGLRIVGRPVTEVPYAVAVRQESRGLLRAINEVLAEMEADGSLDGLRQHWFAPTR